MVPKVTFTSYYLDENIGSAFIEFSKREPGLYGEFDIPEDIKTIVYYKEARDGTYQYIEVVAPEVFINAPELVDFEVNGFNIRTLIVEAYAKNYLGEDRSQFKIS
ncbi:hypothetical protein [Streptococcus sp. NLN64]|uniref:hypothetical protein n=1 Tax=Streptococcus sp. NLN64 TaxID=2822799 RepID=UPI0018CB313B|nr:hypothetical protein [Streptococcus sp. NLN64]MBG9367708.1 hypothetical protein [Streptococcus sp. NLN64]